MNGEVCCILGVCCPPNSLAQQGALAKWMAKQWKLEPDTAMAYAKDMLSVADLAPKGTAQPMLKAGYDLAKAHPKG